MDFFKAIDNGQQVTPEDFFDSVDMDGSFMSFARLTRYLTYAASREDICTEYYAEYQYLQGLYRGRALYENEGESANDINYSDVEEYVMDNPAEYDENNSEFQYFKGLYDGMSIHKDFGGVTDDEGV